VLGRIWSSSARGAPRLALAEQAVLPRSRGRRERILERASPESMLRCDIARWPDPHPSENIRVEHWVVAERQGRPQRVTCSGRARVFRAVPFFWSQHYDVPINYVGHAEKWDEIAIDGEIGGRDCLLKYKSQWSRARGRLDLSRPRQAFRPSIDGAGDDALNRLISNPVSNMFDEEKIEKLQVGYSYNGVEIVNSPMPAWGQLSFVP